eukprot:TRINITY_DN5424_c0_g1_i2.p1 TRINITY_DN5424_c0_g1~~TRINITY_DN5424_c0_g1_i2.p1  ORF type:complete len:244 (-),score=39.71 TRINITY_DN5424_c0_g1_i2:151-882(-)
MSAVAGGSDSATRSVGSSLAVDNASPAIAELLAPLGGQLTLGSTLGFCAGAALRTVGRAAAVGVGSTFCLLQVLAYRGYIQVDWRNIERDYLRLLDRDEDGRVTAGDLSRLWRVTTDVLAFNLPAGAGFTAGLAYGLGATAGMSWKAAVVTGLGGKLLLPRVAAGGLASVGSPVALVGMQDLLFGGRTSAQRTTPWPLAQRQVPGYCFSSFLGEPEERCVWASDFSDALRRRRAEADAACARR